MRLALTGVHRPTVAGWDPVTLVHTIMVRRASFLFLLSGMFLFCGNNYAAAQSGLNVLLVINDASEASRAIGEYYVRKRNIPPANVCHISAKTDETVQRQEFDLQIQQPIAKCITGPSAQDRILYIVLAKGVPMRIEGTGGRDGTVASVDSELTLLYRRLTGVAVRAEGPVPNPYFAGSSADGLFKPFTHEHWDIFLVTRLDGFTVEDVLGLIDRASVTSQDGKIVLDGRATLLPDRGNDWLSTAGDRLKSLGLGERIEIDQSAKVLTGKTRVLGYYSWGSNDPAIRIRHFDFKFVPGALAAMYVSSDARTFKQPPADWTIGDSDKKDTYFAGSPQSLTGDLIHDGVTGIAGHVAEPFLDATIRPDLLFPAYVTGANLAEAFYQAMPYLSWQTVVIGDPLCAPFRKETLAAEAIDKGVDPQTELPSYLSQRRLQLATRSGLKLEAATAMLRAEVRIAHQNVDGAIEALEEASKAEPRLTAAHALLGTIYLGRNQYDEAIERYRKVLALAPNDPLSLNNLAYTLAVHQHAPREALPLAERANTLVSNNPMFRDTLAWIQHLLERDQDALPSMQIAAAGAPNNAEVRWHAAAVYEALHDVVRATTELDAALKLDPKVAELEDVRTLQARLAGIGTVR